MRLGTLGLAVAAGVAAALVVGVAVTEVALAWVEFSLFVGIPAGVAAGAFVAAAVYLGLADDAPAARRRVATSVGGFGVAFVVVLVLAAVVGQPGAVVALVLAGVAGVAVGGATYYSHGGGGRSL